MNLVFRRVTEIGLVVTPAIWTHFGVNRGYKLDCTADGGRRESLRNTLLALPDSSIVSYRSR